MALSMKLTRTPDPREVKKMADRVIDAENELAKVRAEWEALFSPQEEDASKGTLSDRIAELLTHNFDTTYTSNQVTSVLAANPNSVGPLLSRLVSEGKIRKVGHGEYRGHSPKLAWMDDDEINLDSDGKGPEALPS